MDQIRRIKSNLYQRWESLNYEQKLFAKGYVLIHGLMSAGALYLYFNYGLTGILKLLAEYAEYIKASPYGGPILVAMIVLASFPPLIGYGTAITLCGFAFGPLEGWIFAALGCLTGASLSYLLARTVAKNLFRSVLEKDKTFVALGRAVKVKGLTLIVLIRLCPFPFPYSNVFFATIDTVTFSQFFISTLAITPKLFLHVWVGSRLFSFADPNQREQMDTATKIANAVYVVAGGLLGAGTSWYLYRLTMQYVQEIGLSDEENPVEEESLIRGEEGTEDDLDTPIYRPTPTAAIKRSNSSPITNHQSLNQPSNRSTPNLRQSEEGWGGNFSDFGDPESEEEGLPMQPIVTMQKEGSNLGQDKRRD